MGSKVNPVVRKASIFRPSGRSSDFITPSFGYGCLFNCTYCYMKRHKPDGLDYATNIEHILTQINNHAWFTEVDKPNQTHPEFITYDISCNEDFALHSKYYPWERIFEFFRDQPVAMATLATKTVPTEFLSFDPKGKVRIRFSLMPERLRRKLEPNTAQIIDRIKAIDAFIEAGYDVHVNFSPVVIYDKWTEDYIELFQMLDDYVEDTHKHQVLAEVIFLTHNEKKHQDNIVNGLRGEHLLWVPDMQEDKTSQYGGNNVRYKRGLKRRAIEDFKQLHESIIPWNKIRYIF